MNDPRHSGRNFLDCGEGKRIEDTLFTKQKLLTLSNEVNSEGDSHNGRRNLLNCSEVDIQTLEKLLQYPRKKAAQLRKIRELCLANERLFLNVLQKELDIPSKNWICGLMREAAHVFGFHYYPGNKSFQTNIMRIAPQDRVGHSVVEVYESFSYHGAGDTRTLQSVKNQFQLSDEELVSFVQRIQNVSVGGYHLRLTGKLNQKLTERRLYKA
ncbi:MAG: hypothetical protein Q8P05_02820 [Candidatus Diapherotrites archaeon]|nr:hypothetical protein [Candidatus Diapherotrites archaeon]